MAQRHPTQRAHQAERDTPSGDGIGRSLEHVEQEIARGDTARTPFLVLTSMVVIVAVVFAIVLLIVILAWLLA